jgi:hypothetical protein
MQQLENVSGIKHIEIPFDGTPESTEIIAGSTKHFKVYVRNRKGPCFIKFDKACFSDITIAASLTEVEPKASSNDTYYKMNSTLKVKVPPRDKLFYNDIGFLENFIYITVRSNHHIKLLRIKVAFV